MILITGATGNIGRELVRDLDAKGARIRMFVRDAARAAALFPRVEYIVGDWDEPATLTPAFAGVDRLFLLTPGIGIDHVAVAVAAARAAGVHHIAHLSSYNVLGDPMPAMGRWHYEREEIIRSARIPATFLRPAGFMTNALEWLTTINDGNFVVDPLGPGRVALIDPADIAAVAAVVLTTDGHEGKQYTLTGDEALTVTEQVRTIAEATGREIEVREAATPAEALAFRYPGGAPPALADALIEGLTIMRADTIGFQTDTVQRLLGRRPGTFADWCARNVRAFTSSPG